MTQSRQSQVLFSDTPYYHCISRCVRRAYLCGEDEYTDKSVEYRGHEIHRCPSLLFIGPYSEISLD